MAIMAAVAMGSGADGKGPLGSASVSSGDGSKIFHGSRSP